MISVGFRSDGQNSVPVKPIENENDKTGKQKICLSKSAELRRLQMIRFSLSPYIRSYSLENSHAVRTRKLGRNWDATWTAKKLRFGRSLPVGSHTVPMFRQWFVTSRFCFEISMVLSLPKSQSDNSDETGTKLGRTGTPIVNNSLNISSTSKLLH